MFSMSRRHAASFLGGLLGATTVLARFGGAIAAASPADAAFESIVKRWLDEGLRLSPIYATYIGDHRYDGEIDDVSPAGRAARVRFLKDSLSALQAVDRAKLSRANQADATERTLGVGLGRIIPSIRSAHDSSAYFNKCCENHSFDGVGRFSDFRLGVVCSVYVAVELPQGEAYCCVGGRHVRE